MVVAAGASTRLPGSVAKPYLRAGARSLLGHVLACLERSPSVGAVVVVAAPRDLARARRIARRYARVAAVVPGGERRQDSVACGARALPPEYDPVLVHDAARPLVRPELVEATVRAALRHGAAIAATPVVDTIKEVRGARVARTVDRARLWRAETPQGFRRRTFERALAGAAARAVEASDDAMLLEAAGHRVVVVPSPALNLKVTTTADLAVVRALLRGAR